MAEAFYNEKAEKSIIAAILTDQPSAKYIAQLVSADFYPENHQKIFTAMQALYAEHKAIDLVTLSDTMRSMFGTEEVTLAEAAVEIVTQYNFGSSWAMKSHVEIVKAAALRRRMMEIIEGAKAELLEEQNETVTVLDKTRQALRDMVITGHSWVSIQDVLISACEAFERRQNGQEPSMPSGIGSMDAVLTGFFKGELTIIGARPSVGKSALGAHIALATAGKGYKVGICSREMTAVQYGSRIISRDAEVDNSRMRTGDLDQDDWARIADAMMLNSNLNVSFIFSTRYIEDLRMEVQKKVDSGELDMLVVDYVQLLQTKKRFEKDYMRIAYVSKALKDMTTDLNISIIALAQVGRASEGTMPTLAELRGSGDLEQDADNVIFLHRPMDAGDKFIRPEDRELYARLSEQGLQYMAVNVAKQRQGSTGALPVIFNPARMRFTAIDRR